MPIRRACLASTFAAGCVIRAVPSSEAARERLGDSQLPPPSLSSPQSSAFTPRLDWRGPCALPGAVYGLRPRALPAEHAPRR